MKGASYIRHYMCDNIKLYIFHMRSHLIHEHVIKKIEENAE